MGMPAVAAYLQTLREARGLSRSGLARRAEVSEMVVWRLEVKQGSVQSSSLAALAAVLQADIPTIHRLLLDLATTPEDGRGAAAVTLGQATSTINAPPDDTALLAELEALMRAEPTFATLLRQVLRAWQLAQARPEQSTE